MKSLTGAVMGLSAVILAVAGDDLWIMAAGLAVVLLWPVTP